MNPLALIKFDETGFTKKEQTYDVAVWFTPDGDGMGLFNFAIPPDIPVALDRIDELRQSYRRNIADAGGAMIELEVVEVDGCRAVKFILKTPQQPTGMAYVGSLTIPFRDCSYVVKVQCGENGVTGLREAMVMDRFLGDGTVQIVDGKLVGWMSDPYDSTVELPLMRNRAEDPSFDSEFPDHPLSRARRTLAHVERSLRIDPELKSRPAFDGVPPPAAKRPWWRLR